MYKPKVEICEDMGICKVLEYLGLGWKPYTDNDERLLGDEREKMRIVFTDERPLYKLTPEQDLYFNQMHKAVAVLESLIRNQKIKLHGQEVLHTEWTQEPFISDEILSRAAITEIENEKPSSVRMRFEPYNDNDWFISESGCNYRIELKNKYGNFIYNDNPGIVKFSELEPYYEDEKDNGEISTPKVMDFQNFEYLSPYMEIMFEVIKENGISYDNQGNSDSLKVSIKDKMKNRNLPESDNLVSAMATLIRLPEAQKGRSYHSRKRAK